MPKRVVIVGGAGVFGGRLAEVLSGRIDADVVIAGRSLTRASEAMRRVGAGDAVALDRRSVTASDLRRLEAAVIVDAAGPFQGVDFTLPEAAIAAGLPYVDLADSRAFVAAFPRLDAAARAAGVAVITGASSTPALTHAALDALVRDWRRIDRITAAISPGARAPRGRAVAEAILDWAGAPVRVFVDGAWATAHGWSSHRRIMIDGVGRRNVALADTPDLDLIVARHAPTDSAEFLAGLEPPALHHALGALAWLRRIGLAPSLRPFAGAALWLSGLFRPFGADAGGMLVEAWGRDASDAPVRARWSLAAPSDRGPYTPGLPAAAVVRKLLAGEIEPRAHVCAGLVGLDDVADDLERLGIATSMSVTRLTAPFETALGARFNDASPAVIAAHRAGPVARFTGAADVTGAATPLAAIAAWIVGFPAAATQASTHVTMRMRDDGAEEWRRAIGHARFRSVLRAVGKDEVEERFGPMTFRMRLSVTDGVLGMRVAGWRVGPLPLPAFLAPRSDALEAEDAAGRFTFNVPIAAPLVGRLVHYAGVLTPTP